VIEIVCPNCQARYQLPDGAIGAEGRKVSCSSCAHKWRAHPEGPAEMAPAAPAPRERTAAEAMASLASGGSGSAAPPASPPPASGNRDEQMAAIRRMLSDLKEAADTVPDRSDGAEERSRPEPAPASLGPSARRRDDDAPNRDRLEDRIDDVNILAKMVKGEPTGSGYDAAKLRKRHEKRAKRMQRSRERRKKSGAFLTGFTLVAVVSSVMVGLYVMHPRIIAASPEMAPALVEYVTTVDRYRVEFDETTQDWREWLTERIANLTGKEEE
jgi:predicted Zn finger-like uncharacterized protein